MLKICKYCGKEFDTNREKQKFCTRECSLKYWNKKNAERIKINNADLDIIKGNTLEHWCLMSGTRGSKLLLEYSEKNSIRADIILAGSLEKALWKCSICGCEWRTPVSCRTRNLSDCPKCTGREACEDDNLLKWCEEHGNYGKRLIDEYSPENSVDIKKIKPYSNKRVLWECSDCGNKWQTVVANRTKAKSGCPKCNKSSTSFGEQLIYYVLKRELNSYSVLNRKKVKGFELDIFIPEIKLGIEYNGFNFHKNRIEQDKLKINTLKLDGIKILTILEYNKNTDIGDIKYDFAFERNIDIDKNNIHDLLSFISKYLNEAYNIEINIELNDDEIEQCRLLGRSNYIDVIEILLLQCLEMSNYKIAELLNCNRMTIGSKLKAHTKDNIEEIKSNIKEIISSLKLGYSPEEIASNSVEADTSIFEFDVDDKTYDLDFVIKIKSLLEKYKAI